MLETKHGRQSAIKSAMQMAVLWCYFKYGRSIWNVAPLRVSICNTMRKLCGYYETYELETTEGWETIAMIRINPSNHSTLKSVVETVIHEYIHHLQQIDMYERYFSLGYNYSDHPFEKEASAVALRDTDECFKWISDRLQLKLKEDINNEEGRNQPQ